MIRRMNRYEFKFLVHDSDRDRLIPALRERLAPDPHGTAEGAYRVTSLYLDSCDLECFWSKLEGIRYRRKVRVRVYGDEPARAERAAVEIKQRVDRTVAKRRVALGLEDALTLTEGRLDEKLLEERDLPVAREVEFLVRALHLQPTCVIAYLRRAFIGGHLEPRLRVTFDEELVCRGPSFDPDRAGGAVRFLPAGWSIMEVKVDQRIPLWITELIGRHRCRFRRISKYCSGLARLRSLPFPALPA